MVECKHCTHTKVCAFKLDNKPGYPFCNQCIPYCIGCEYSSLESEEVTGNKYLFCKRTERVELVSAKHFCAYGKPKGEERVQEEKDAEDKKDTPEDKNEIKETEKEKTKTNTSISNSVSRKHVDIYTDGACKGNPGPGGWGSIIIFGNTEKEICGGEAPTTNNRMELTAVISALSLLKESCEVTLTTDSKYVVDAINKGWLASWKKNGWKKADKKPVLNIDLWDQMLTLLEKHTVTFNWIKGHAGHPYNERCDKLASDFAQTF